MQRLCQPDPAAFDQGARMFGPQKRSELFFANAAPETAARFAKACMFEHFGEETGLQLLCDLLQGSFVRAVFVQRRGQGAGDGRDRVANGITSD